MLQQVTGANAGEQLQICEVCRRLNNDLRLKLCRWCDFCGVWICRHDQKDYARRAAAALAGWF